MLIVSAMGTSSGMSTRMYNEKYNNTERDFSFKNVVI
jgi:hypothetical protein